MVEEDKFRNKKSSNGTTSQSLLSSSIPRYIPPRLMLISVLQIRNTVLAHVLRDEIHLLKSRKFSAMMRLRRHLFLNTRLFRRCRIRRGFSNMIWRMTLLMMSRDR
jgi:hypothetical protein